MLRRTRVLIADDHALLAEGIAGFLSPEYDIVGLVADGRRLLTEAARLLPDLIVLDISMPGLNGIEAALQLRKLVPKIKLVFVTQQVNSQYLRAALQAGASAYVVKQSASDELKAALRTVASGRIFVSPILSEKVDYAPVEEILRGKSSSIELTPRQREVLQLLAEGRTSREIALVLGISTKTVEFHRKSLMDQTGLRTTAELTRYAVSIGIISL